MKFKVKNVVTALRGQRKWTVLEIEARTKKWGSPSARVLLLDNGNGRLDGGDRIIEFHRKSGYCGGSKFVRVGRNSKKNYCVSRKVDVMDIVVYGGIADRWFKTAQMQEWKSVKQFNGNSTKKPITYAYCLPKRARSMRYIAGRYHKHFSRPITLKRAVAKALYTDREIRKIRGRQKADPAKCTSIVVKNIRVSFAGIENSITLSWNGPTFSAMSYLGMFGIKLSAGAVFSYKDKATGVFIVHTGLGQINIQNIPTSQISPGNFDFGSGTPGRK